MTQQELRTVQWPSNRSLHFVQCEDCGKPQFQHYFTRVTFNVEGPLDMETEEETHVFCNAACGSRYFLRRYEDG